MRFLIGCLLFTFLFATVAVGKQGRGLQRIHAARMTYITDRIQLQPGQSARFVPVYNEYEKEMRGIRKEYYRKYKIKPGSSEDNLMSTRQQIEEDLDYQERIIELKRKYNDRFLAVISPGQLSEMYVAEREFRQMLIKRLKEKGGRGK